MTKKLALIGSGIKTISHLTIEAQSYIKAAQCVLYLVNEPVLEQWLKQYTQQCVSLEPVYFAHTQRNDAYRHIADEVLSYFETYDIIALVIYGHPTVFAAPGLYAIEKAKALNMETVILPGISAEDCLFADLAIDPSEHGCLSIDATPFIFFDDPINPFVDLVLWQVGMVGCLRSVKHLNIEQGFHLLKQKLLATYAESHLIILYEASLYPALPPKITHCPLSDLAIEMLTTITTLYIPAKKRQIDQGAFFKQFNH